LESIFTPQYRKAPSNLKLFKGEKDLRTNYDLRTSRKTKSHIDYSRTIKKNFRNFMNEELSQELRAFFNNKIRGTALISFLKTLSSSQLF